VINTGWIVLLLAFSVYGGAIIGVVILIQAVVRISRAATRISQSLEEISAGMRSDATRR
jgi:hypothetical protein